MRKTTAPRSVCYPESVLGFTHRFVPGDAGAGRVLLLLHGTGGDENDLLPLGQALDPQAALLSPRGKVLERGMPRFFRRLAEGVFDLEDLEARAHELADFVTAAAAHYRFDPDRVCAVGFSNGANIAGALLLLEPGRLAEAILFSPMVPLVPEPTPDLGRTPVFIGAGRSDPIVPAAETERLAELLRRCGAVVTLHWTDAGHAVEAGEVAAARSWLERLARPKGA
ncbi:MAG TPA: alpha/beta hydrolase [Candidatus Limnocylindria bacterium]|nr:alpha/beta hydrolase [Candidatus Limnocylindria bacterium]